MAAALVLVLVSCGHAGGSNQGAIAYTDHKGAGPLSLKSAAGILSLKKQTPGTSSWSATWGGLQPCLKSGGVATITSVTPVFVHRPVDFHIVLRDVQRPVGVSEQNSQYEPIMASYGVPLSFGEGGIGRVAGTAKAMPSTVTISSRCRSSTGRRFRELLVVLTVDSRGAEIERTDVRFLYLNRSYVLHVPLVMIACGSATGKKFCSQ